MKPMLKKLGVPLLTLAALLFLIPAPQAKAGVRFSVVIGGPAYVAPAPVYPYAYPPMYPVPDYYAPGFYNAYPAYPYPAPAYVYPYANWNWHRRDDRGRGNHGRQYNHHEDRGNWRR